MKKWIMAAVCVVGLSGFTAAQTTTSKSVKKSPAKQAVTKGKTSPTGTDKKTATVKDTVKFKLPTPAKLPDSLQVPKGKNEQ